MINPIIKTKEEIEKMREGGAILSNILKEISIMIKPGIGTAELDEYAEKKMREQCGEPAFKGYRADSKNPFPTTICASINDEVVHGPAVPDRILKKGDIIGIDVGMKYKNFYTDMAATFGVGRIDKNAKKLIYATQESLNLGLKKIKDGVELSEIGRAIENYIRKRGFFIVCALTGHGVGKKLHEPPMIPNYFDSDLRLILREGMTLAIEPMVCEYSADVVTASDKWTICAKDGGRAAHFEVSIVVVKKGFDILTPKFW